MKLATIINLSRGGGKTTTLVYVSAMGGVPILCFSKSHANYIKYVANTLGLEIPEPLTCCTNDVKELGNLGVTKILIDDAEVTVPALINELTGAQVCGMTMSVPMISPKRNGNTSRFDISQEL